MNQREYDQAIEALRRGFCKLPRFSFMKDAQGSVRKVPDKTGNFVEFTSAHELFDPVMVDSLLAKMLSDVAIDAAIAQQKGGV